VARAVVVVRQMLQILVHLAVSTQLIFKMEHYLLAVTAEQLRHVLPPVVEQQMMVAVLVVLAEDITAALQCLCMPQVRANALEAVVFAEEITY
jgi:hypothetical protein